MSRSKRGANRETGFTNIHLGERDRVDCEDVEFAVSDWLTDIRANPRPAINAEPARAHALGFRFPVFAQDYACHACETSLPPASHVQSVWHGFSDSGSAPTCYGKRRITCSFRLEVVTKPTAGSSRSHHELVLNTCGRNKSLLPSSLSITLPSSLRVLLHSHALNSLNARAYFIIRDIVEWRKFTYTNH